MVRSCEQYEVEIVEIDEPSDWRNRVMSQENVELYRELHEAIGEREVRADLLAPDFRMKRDSARFPDSEQLITLNPAFVLTFRGREIARWATYLDRAEAFKTVGLEG